MKIGIISTYFGESMGGADISTLLYVKELKRKGINVKIATTSNTKGCFRLKFFRWLPINIVAFLLNTNIFDWYLRMQIKKFVNYSNIEIIHVQDITLLPAVVKVARKLKLPIIATVRDYRFVCNLPVCQQEGQICFNCSNFKYWKCLKLYSKNLNHNIFLSYLTYPFIYNRSKVFLNSLKQCNKVIAVSDYVSNVLAVSGIKNSKLMTIYNCVPEVKTNLYGKKEFVILLPVATLAKYKGVHYALRAFNEILIKVPNSILIVTGEGPEKDNLIRFSKKLGLKNSVKFVGKISYEKMGQYYSGSSVVILPSLWPEPLSRTIFDAFSYGKPVVAFDVGGTREMVVNGKTGFVIPKKDYVGMSKALIKLNIDLKLYNHICSNVLSKSKNHNLNEIKKYLEIYNLFFKI